MFESTELLIVLKVSSLPLVTDPNLQIIPSLLMRVNLLSFQVSIYLWLLLVRTHAEDVIEVHGDSDVVAPVRHQLLEWLLCADHLPRIDYILYIIV
jgi:hypothetical protein